MAYQQVSTPRFYLNELEFLNANGVLGIGASENYLRTLPVNPATPSFPYGGDPSAEGEGFGSSYYKFVAILGHNFPSVGDELTSYYRLNATSDQAAMVELEGIVNSERNGVNQKHYAPYNGFSIATFEETTLWEFGLGQSDQEIGSLIFGNYYDMPHSPDLSLTMTREYGGVKTIETKGGASLSNSFYTKPAMWGSLGAWELSSASATAIPVEHALSRSGRRVWSLSFSYLDDGDVFGAFQSLGIASGMGVVTPENPFYWFPIDQDTISEYDTDDIRYDTGQNALGFNSNILYDNTFFSRVLHRTIGAGNLPFIFNPTGGGSNPNNQIDNFAICKFDMKSFQFKQVANGLYNIKLKIREVW